jgi:hypothetical protein
MAALLFALPIVAGAGAGYAAGGNLANLAATRFRALWLLWAAAAAQFADLIPSARTYALVGTFAMAVCWLVVNALSWPAALRCGARVVAAGGLLNAAAIAANGRMPYSGWAAATAGIGAGRETARNVAATHATRLLALGDVLPVPPLRAVFSIGDLFICCGIVTMIIAGMRTRPDSAPRPRLPVPRTRKEVT